MGKLTVYEAINQMRELSKAGEAFSFSFMSYSDSKQTTEGIVEVRRGRLTAKSAESDIKNADLLQPYTDLDIMEPRRFYIPTLMTFNGQKTRLL
ncbi:hypothetical protein GCM10027284_08860 [Cyclobacterium sediminis]